MIRKALILFLFALPLFLAGCGGMVDQKASDRIAAVLPRVLGPAKSYDVTTSGASLSLSHGHIGKVQIHAEDVTLAPALVVDTLDAVVTDISLDTRSQKVTEMGPIRFTVGVSAAHLNDYLSATAASAPSRPEGLCTQVDGQSLALSFLVRPLGVGVPVTVAGVLIPCPGRPTQLDFVPNGAHVSIVPVPAGVVNLALSHVNPVVDLGGMRIPLAIDHTWIASGDLYLSGTATIPPSEFTEGAH